MSESLGPDTQDGSRDFPEAEVEKAARAIRQLEVDRLLADDLDEAERVERLRSHWLQKRRPSEPGEWQPGMEGAA